MNQKDELIVFKPKSNSDIFEKKNQKFKVGKIKLQCLYMFIHIQIETIIICKVSDNLNHSVTLNMMTSLYASPYEGRYHPPPTRPRNAREYSTKNVLGTR